MQLNEDKMDALVNDCLKITEGRKHPFSKDSHVWTDMEAVVNLVLERAQADARPFGWWYSDKTGEHFSKRGPDSYAPGDLSEYEVKVTPLYTHPEASAPGLSEREIADTVNKVRDIAREFHATQQLRERIARVLVPILTRASAATVGEASDKLDVPAQVDSAQRDLKVCLADAQRTVSTTKKALSDLVNAVRWWGSQEDGIPVEVASAFNAAHLALGWSLSHPTDFKAAAQQSKQNSAHEWDASGERCLKCGDKDWFADSTCSGKAAQSGQQAGVEEIAKLREAVDDAAYEWAQYVDVDRAPRTLQKHMLDAFDAATPTQQREGGK